jgi:hypothetical protein
VRVDGAGTGDSYQLVITDRGVGMRPEQLEELNAVLRDPPVTGLALGRALGCLVAARLAARHGITVRLRAGEDEGVVAYVLLPSHLLVNEPAEPRPTPLPAAPREVRGAPADEDAASRDRSPTPVRLSDALPARSEFDAGIQALLDREGQPTLVEPPVPTREPASVGVGEDAAALRRRVPGATAEALPDPILEPPRPRDPEDVRARLSRYRSGLEAGRSSDMQVDEERS